MTPSAMNKEATRCEAMRQAKHDIKRQIKADGGKLAHFAASDITRWAKELIADDPSYLRNARRRLKRRAAA